MLNMLGLYHKNKKYPSSLLPPKKVNQIVEVTIIDIKHKKYEYEYDMIFTHYEYDTFIYNSVSLMFVYLIRHNMKWYDITKRKKTQHDMIE